MSTETLAKALRDCAEIDFDNVFVPAARLLESQAAEIEALKAKLASYEAHGVTCQTFGHVVGACAECNTHDESKEAEIAALKADIATYVRAASEQATEIEHLKDVLSFVERWANHHGAKPSLSAVETLSVIQHHPAIKEITKSYADGVVPDTRDPYAEIEALRFELESARAVNLAVVRRQQEEIEALKKKLAFSERMEDISSSQADSLREAQERADEAYRAGSSGY